MTKDNKPHPRQYRPTPPHSPAIPQPDEPLPGPPRRRDSHALPRLQKGEEVRGVLLEPLRRPTTTSRMARGRKERLAQAGHQEHHALRSHHGLEQGTTPEGQQGLDDPDP